MSTLDWKYCCGCMCDNGAERIYRCEGLSVYKNLYTRRKKSGEWGVGRVFYEIDGDKRKFKTEEELIKAIGELIKAIGA